ncbi:hypothetical protein ABZY16_16555 [Streptomyces sp. NPDC006553]|uniref:hypothetical protein n=1 Tax=Streptomyces sp. NPDC006553 TaxID=3157180 RepID=UPI0033BF094C
MAGERPLASNFGLPCQVRDRGNVLQARDPLDATYRRLAGGRPFAQGLRGFLACRADTASRQELQACMPFRSSVLDLTAGPVDQLFTDAEHTGLTAGFRRFRGSILAHSPLGLTVTGILDDVLVVGPELEFLWDKPVIDAHCQVPACPSARTPSGDRGYPGGLRRRDHINDGGSRTRFTQWLDS